MAVGDTVLARDFDRDGEFAGWWEAVLLAPFEGDGFTLAWRDPPEQGRLIRRRRAELAPLHPGGSPQQAG